MVADATVVKTKKAMDQKDDMPGDHNETELSVEGEKSDSNDEQGGAWQEVIGEPRAMGELGTGAPVLSRGEFGISETERYVSHRKSVCAEDVATGGGCLY